MTVVVGVHSDGQVYVVARDRCAKRAFPRRRDAVRAAKQLPHAVYVYECRRCARWHLTSQRPRDGRGRAF